MTENIIQTFASAHPPEFSPEDVLKIAEDLYGITGELTALWGERDQNFMITSSDHDGYVIKISNRLEEELTIDFQIKALQHLARFATNVAVPSVIQQRDGSLSSYVTAKDGNSHLVHMISLRPGVTVGETSFAKKVWKAVGKQAGLAAIGLRGFFHPVAAQPMFWDARHLGDFSRYIPQVSDASLRKAMESFVPAFCDDVLPLLGNLRSQVIHHDTNLSNVLVDEDSPTTMTGLIDFGDMIHGTIAQDVAVAAAEMATGETDHLDKIVSLIHGYDLGCPLEEQEIDLQYDLIVARMIQGSLIGIVRNENEVVSQNDQDYLDLYGPALEGVLSAGREKTRERLRAACRFPEYCPPDALPVGTNQEKTESLLKRRYEALGTELSITYEKPLHTVRGEGVWLWDVDGRRYLDCYNNVPHVGHCHPHVVNALSRQAAALNTNTRYLFENAVQYAERLKSLTPGKLGACLYVNSGSEANDLALRMAKTCTGQTGAIVVDGAYHGVTTEIHALSPSNEWGMDSAIMNSHPAYTRDDIQTVANPDTIRGPYRDDDPDAGRKYAADADRAIRELDEAGHPVGAFMVDSAFSTHGILDVPDGYVDGVADRVRDAGGMIIADEVQYGFGRSGNHMWGFENYGITPDFITLGKPIGNGIALGVVVTTPEILEEFTRKTDFFSTFGGNPVVCAAALAVADVIEEENLMENCRVTGEYLRAGLRSVSKGSSNVGGIRGKGLFIGADIVSDPDAMTPDAKERARIQNHLRNNGFLVGSDGYHHNLLKIRPPMVFQKSHADMFVEAFEKAINDR